MGLSKPVFLCGFMGCGKSTVGRILAKRLGCRFDDMDRLIEEKEGKKISRIFEESGEEYFRMIETNMIKGFDGGGRVIATGGGAMLRRENAKAAGDIGTVIFIDTSFKVCYNRIKGDKRRPLAYNSTEAELFSLYKKRYCLYKKNSTAAVDGNVPAAVVAKNIETYLKGDKNHADKRYKNGRE